MEFQRSKNGVLTSTQHRLYPFWLLVRVRRDVSALTIYTNTAYKQCYANFSEESILTCAFKEILRRKSPIHTNQNVVYSDLLKIQAI